jgi:hypothetical protein
MSAYDFESTLLNVIDEDQWDTENTKKRVVKAVETDSLPELLNMFDADRHSSGELERMQYSINDLTYFLCGLASMLVRKGVLTAEDVADVLVRR